MVLIDSLYINNSGGKVLLDYLVEKLEDSGANIFYLFDARCASDFRYIPDNRKFFLRATLKSRRNFYKTHKAVFSKVLCFGNIPPPVRLKIPVYTYFHNVSLLHQPQNYSLKEKYLKKLKLFAIQFFNSTDNIFIVQSLTVQKLLAEKFKNNSVLVLPFFREKKSPDRGAIKKSTSSFVYVSNGNTHKNHEKLLDAWELLANNNLYPELHLTVTDNYKHLISRIGLLKGRGLNIINHGFCDPIKLYKSSKFLIYPSLAESFGLGLIEAIDYGCEVIASDLDYVYEICEPFSVFNPESSADIAQKVQCAISSIDKTYRTTPVIKNQIKEIIELLKD